MSLAVVHSRAIIGIEAPPVTVEVHLTNGLPALSIVGLPEAAVRESKDRVRSAILNSHFEFPRKKITINLAPADLPKEGGRYDLPIALGILAASGQIPKESLKETEFLAELALSGLLRPISGSLPASLACQKTNRALCVAMANAEEASLPPKAKVLPGNTLLDICAHLNNKLDLNETCNRSSASVNIDAPERREPLPLMLDISEVKGQQRAKRALEIAAAGGHNLIMIGPPGTGKTMLASRLPSILPELSDDEAIEVAAIYSIHQHRGLDQNWKQRPFRSPHHTASAVALVGGGSHPKPGEISLAHHGVLFLDEFPEYDRKVLEVLREPLESGEINISRAAQQVLYPAKFQLIAAMNPCPCGYLGDLTDRCHCTEDQILRYRSKLSGPLMDRIDIHAEVPMLKKELFLNIPSTPETIESSKDISKRVHASRAKQLSRQGKANTFLNNKELEALCVLSDEAKLLIAQAMEKLNFSPRVYHRLLKVSRTIADLNGEETITANNISEAISFRSLDRKK